MMLTDVATHGLRVFGGKVVSVVGSAPSVVVRPSAVIIAANGGAYVARDCGQQVDVLATTAHFCGRSSRQQRETIDRWHGLRVRQVWADLTDGPLERVRATLADADVDYDTLIGVSKAERNAIVQVACGEALGAGPRDQRVSTGVFAACLAFAGGAAAVVLAGISLQGGHAGLAWDTAERPHVPADTACLTALRTKYTNTVLTTSDELSEVFGMRRAA